MRLDRAELAEMLTAQGFLIHRGLREILAGYFRNIHHANRLRLAVRFPLVAGPALSFPLEAGTIRGP